MVATDGREALKEVVDRFASLQVFDQGLDRYTGACEDGVPPSTSGEEVMRGVVVAMVSKDNGASIDLQATGGLLLCPA